MAGVVVPKHYLTPTVLQSSSLSTHRPSSTGRLWSTGLRSTGFPLGAKVDLEHPDLKGFPKLAALKGQGMAGAAQLRRLHLRLLVQSKKA